MFYLFVHILRFQCRNIAAIEADCGALQRRWVGDLFVGQIDYLPGRHAYANAVLGGPDRAQPRVRPVTELHHVERLVRALNRRRFGNRQKVHGPGVCAGAEVGPLRVAEKDATLDRPEHGHSGLKRQEASGEVEVVQTVRLREPDNRSLGDPYPAMLVGYPVPDGRVRELACLVRAHIGRSDPCVIRSGLDVSLLETVHPIGARLNLEIAHSRACGDRGED